MESPYTVHVLHNGYCITDHSEEEDIDIEALIDAEMNCTSTLVKGPINIIIDTMTPWDGKLLLSGLRKHKISPNEIELLVNTHLHSCHTGNNNLFLKAKHLVGENISYEHKYYSSNISSGEEYLVDEYIRIIPTPGHTMSDVSVLVETNLGLIAITGDLFVEEMDLEDDNIWKSNCNNDSDEDQQYLNRLKILEIADYIVPGHGPMFKVTKEIRDKYIKKKNK